MVAYSYSTIDVPGGEYAEAMAINDSGQIIGDYIDSNGYYQAFLDIDGVIMTIDPGGSPNNTYALSINNSGQIVGYYTNSSGNFDGFLYSGGIYTTIDPPGSVNTVAYGSTYTIANSINSSGQIAGYYQDSSGDLHGFLDSGGVYTTITDPLASTSTVINGINDSGEMAGSYIDNSGNTNLLLDVGGVYTTIDAPGSTYTVATGINDLGEVFGFYRENSGDLSGFVENGGVLTTIDPPGSTNAVVGGVNDLGQIVGGYGPTGHISDGSLAVPITPTLTTLVSFNGANGAAPDGGLIADAAGDLFGTTEVGGADGDGTAFELVNHGGGNYTPTTLLSFNQTNGWNPIAGLTADAAGDLFGTTGNGGTNGYGPVFELVNHGGGNYTPTTLLSFNGANGSNPFAGLIADAAGDLFGTTFAGETGDSTVFELVNHGGGNYTPTTLLSFNQTTGGEPDAGLIADAAGDLFGTTTNGGAYGYGTVFELVNHGGVYTPVTLLGFNVTNGAYAHGDLIADAAGDLFGTTANGGTNDYGTVFELVNHGGGNYTPTTLQIPRQATPAPRPP